MSTETETVFTNQAQWNERLQSFATAVGKPVEEITSLLEPVIGEPSDEALEFLSNPADAPDQAIKEALESLKIPSAKFNAHVKKLRGPEKVLDTMPNITILPTITDDQSFLAALKVGGDLKVGELAVVSGTRVAIAAKAKLFIVLDKIKKKMTSWADSQSITYDENYYEISDMISERDYADVLNVIKVKSRHITEASRNEFLARVDKYLWPALKSFNDQFMSWIHAYNNSAGSSMNMMNTFGQLLAQANGSKSVSPAIFTQQPPDTGVLRAAAESFIDQVNKVFSGAGVPVARALAKDAIRIKDILNKPSILVATGVGTKEQLLRDLDIAASSKMIYAEQNIAQYVLSVMNLPKVVPQDEMKYLAELYALIANIPWTDLGIDSANTNGHSL